MPPDLSSKREELALLTETAFAVALSVLLGTIRLVELPNGGSIALATLPLLALSMVRGIRQGILAGGCAGVAHILAGGTVIHPVQLLLDYPVAYAALGVAGFKTKNRDALQIKTRLRIILAMCLHLGAMTFSGVVFFSQTVGSAAIWYSLTYNALTVVPETILAILFCPMLIRAMTRAHPAKTTGEKVLPLASGYPVKPPNKSDQTGAKNPLLHIKQPKFTTSVMGFSKPNYTRPLSIARPGPPLTRVKLGIKS